MLATTRILDLTRLLPGPYATWLLAGMGAEVIKIEQPGRGDYIRADWPRRGGMSNTFHLYNRGKRSAALNLKADEGERAFLELVETADVVIDGNRPGVLDRLGVGWEVCRARNSRLVFCSITGFGQSGPYAQRVGHDINYLGLSGVLSGMTDADGHPIAPRITVADMAGGGLMGVVGILGALMVAQATGEGRFVDVSMTDSVLSMQGKRLAEELIPGEMHDSDSAVPEDNGWEYGVYRTGDGAWISLDPYERRFKDTLWAIIEGEGVGRRPAPERGREHLREVLAASIAQRPRARWDELLADAEVCYAPVYEIEELARDPNIEARALLSDALNPQRPSPALGSPLRFDPEMPGARDAPAPVLGADTVALLTELGWSPERIRAAAAAEAIAGIPEAAGRR